MSTLLLGQVWPLNLPPTPKFVLVSLADQANDEGLCWPSVGSIARRTGFKERAIQSAISWLEICGYLRRTERKGRSTYYTVTPAAGAPPQEMPPAADAPTPAVGAGAPAADAPTPAAGAPININEPSRTVKEPGSPSASERDELFEAVANACGIDWKRLPKPERGRLNHAVKALREIGATPQEVHRHAAAYRRLWPNVTLTPTALSANWGQCVADARKTQAKAPEEHPDLAYATITGRRLGLTRESGEAAQNFVDRVNRAAARRQLEHMGATA